MAQQESYIKLKGRIGDLTFYETKNGYQVRGKGGVSANRIAKDPAYQRTRENNAEFGQACKSAKKLRDVLRPMILQTADPKMFNRLTSRFTRIVKADAENVRGARKVLPANFTMLKDFNFNEAALLTNTIFINYTAVVNRLNGTATIQVPAFNPDAAIVAPKEATHYQFIASAALLDFDGDASVLVMVETPTLPLFGTGAPQQLVMEIPASSALPVMLIFGISFYQLVRGLHYPLIHGTYDASMVIGVDLAAATMVYSDT